MIGLDWIGSVGGIMFNHSTHEFLFSIDGG